MCRAVRWAQPRLPASALLPASPASHSEPSPLRRSAAQVGFINFIVMPLYTVLVDLLHVAPLVDNLKSNLATMEQEVAEAVRASELAAAGDA